VVNSGAAHHTLADEAAVEEVKASYLMVTLGDCSRVQVRRTVNKVTVVGRREVGIHLFKVLIVPYVLLS
jgi:hypothetical protein